MHIGPDEYLYFSINVNLAQLDITSSQDRKEQLIPLRIGTQFCRQRKRRVVACVESIDMTLALAQETSHWSHYRPLELNKAGPQGAGYFRNLGLETGNKFIMEGRDRSRQVGRVDSVLLCGIGGYRPVASEKRTILEVGVPLKR